MTWVLCNIKNIAVPLIKNKDLDPEDLPYHLSFVEKLSNNTIRVSRVKDWCNRYCKECMASGD